MSRQIPLHRKDGSIAGHSTVDDEDFARFGDGGRRVPRQANALRDGMTVVAFTVHGKPAPKGSVRAFVPRKRDGSIVRRADGAPMVVKNDDSGARGKAWMGDVAKACAEAMDAGEIALMRDVPVAVSIIFHAVRPKSHYRTGRNAARLRDDAPSWPAKRPDVDKWVRAVLDALTATAWADDGQVVELHATKVWGEQAKADVELRVLEPQRHESEQAALVL
jgi:crossover junction endodeoxyribonuclease RusA